MKHTIGFSVATFFSACKNLPGIAPAPGLSTYLTLVRELRERTNVCSSMAFHLCNIRQPANRKAKELSIEGACYRFANGRLANTGRTNKAQDLALDGASKLADGQKFEYAVLLQRSDDVEAYSNKIMVLTLTSLSP